MSDRLLEGEPLRVEELDLSGLKVTHYVVEQKPDRGPTLRSCWECNPAHEHLKDREWLICFICDGVYLKGVKQ